MKPPPEYLAIKTRPGEREIVPNWLKQEKVPSATFIAIECNPIPRREYQRPSFDREIETEPSFDLAPDGEDYADPYARALDDSLIKYDPKYS